MDTLLHLPGSILAVEAMIGIIFNEIATTQADRQRIRGVVANLAATASFDEVTERLESQAGLRNGFLRSLHNALRDVVTDDHDDSPTPGP